MKVLFVITSMGSGLGGHYHSLDHISGEVAKHVEARILSIGPSPSPLLMDNPLFFKHIHYKSWDLIKLNKEFKAVYINFMPDIIHCFDNTSIAVISLLPSCFKIKKVQTLCGGPNPKKITVPAPNALILFSKENYQWYKSIKRLKNTRIYLIPNRVKEFDLLPERKRIYKKIEAEFNFVRISRFSTFYKDTFLQSLNLIRNLLKDHKVRLFFIGVIQQKEVYDQIKSTVDAENLPVTFITGEATKNAKNLLYLADCAIGTGRSLMEAMAKGIPVLAPLKNAEIPVMVTPANFKGLFDTNFSERGYISNSIIEDPLKQIKKLITNKELYKKMSTFSKEAFKENFDVNNAGEKYIEVYSDLNNEPKKRCFFNNILQSIFFIRQFLKIARNV